MYQTVQFSKCCCRILQICDLVRDCVGQPDAECKIDPAPPDSCAEDSTSTILKRCACKDAKPRASLRKIMSHRRSSNSMQSDLYSLASSQGEEYGEREDVQVLCELCAQVCESLNYRMALLFIGNSLLLSLECGVCCLAQWTPKCLVLSCMQCSCNLNCGGLSPLGWGSVMSAVLVGPESLLLHCDNLE